MTPTVRRRTRALMRSRLPRAAGSALCVLVGWAAPVREVSAPASLRAQPPSAEVPTAARQVYEGTMSPFCPGLLLANCPSPQADSLRRALAARAAAGASRAELEADLIATYGDQVRAAPARRGVGLVAWATPALLLAAGAAWLTRRLARAHRVARRPEVTPPDPFGDATRDERATLGALIGRG